MSYGGKLAASVLKTSSVITSNYTVSATDQLVLVDTTGNGALTQISTTDGADTFVGLAGAERIAQSFTPASTFTLYQSTLKLRRNTTPTGNMYIHLYATLGGEPTGSPLETYTYVGVENIAQSPSFTTVTVPWANTTSLVSGTQYIFVLEAAPGSTIDGGSKLIYWMSSNTSSHAGGNYSYRSGGSWTPVTSRDATMTVSSFNSLSITLPSAASTPNGRIVQIKDYSGASSVVGKSIPILAAGSDTIDGLSSYTISSSYANVTLVCNGVNRWSII